MPLISAKARVEVEIKIAFVVILFPSHGTLVCHGFMSPEAFFPELFKYFLITLLIVI